MAVNKVVYVENGVQKTLVDLTADTVTAETLKKGTTAHNKTGAQITGTMESSGGTDLKTMIISFEVLTSGENNLVELHYINKNGEYVDNVFDDFSSSNIIEIEVADPSFIIINTQNSYSYGNVDYDMFGNNGTYSDTDHGTGDTHLGIILTQYMREVWKTSRVVLNLDQNAKRSINGKNQKKGGDPMEECITRREHDEFVRRIDGKRLC